MTIAWKEKSSRSHSLSPLHFHKCGELYDDVFWFVWNIQKGGCISKFAKVIH